MIRISDITYHTGDLEDNPDRWHSEGFHRMLDNMNAGGFGSGDLGYGFLGTGVYHTTDTEDLVMDHKDLKYGYAIVCSRDHYDCYKPQPQDTNAFMMFMSRYQGYIIHKAVKNPEWNRVLQNVHLETLHKTYTGLSFRNTWNFDKFRNFSQKLIYEVKNAYNGWSDTERGIIKPEYDHADNISTRLLKAHGYQGVDLRETAYDNVEHGSVIFDLRKEDIIARFSSFDKMLQFAERLREKKLSGVTEIMSREEQKALAGVWLNQKSVKTKPASQAVHPVL